MQIASFRELIINKRNGLSHSQEEIFYIVNTFTQGKTPAEQMSAWLMAALLKGLTPQETAQLTQAYIQSGVSVDHGSDLPTSDKHSTGGVGDKTSLLIAPLVAAVGGYVPMISGRGLGHTGGTLDKLESIPGFKVNLSLQEFKSQTRQIGACLIGQTKDLCPADGKIYALRDVTGTVESMSLICASIVSKKFAEGTKSIVYDVKWGSGAFMKTLEDARLLAEKLKTLSESLGLKANYLLTDTNAPLGQMAGNSCEIEEVTEILKNGKALNPLQLETLNLSLELAVKMLLLSHPSTTEEIHRKNLSTALHSGAAYKKWLEMVKAQGGQLDRLPKAKHEKLFIAKQGGTLKYKNVSDLGYALIALRAGRESKEDSIDPTAGIEFLKKTGEVFTKGDSLFRVFANSTENFDLAFQKIQMALEGDSY